MAGIYTVSVSSVAVTAAQDLLELTPADDKPLELCGLFISQTSDVGDAADEIIGYQIIRGYTASGSGGSTGTKVPVKRGMPSASFTAEINNTTVANTGTAVVIHDDAFNIRAGLALWFPDGFEPDCTQADTSLVVRIPAPADSLTVRACFWVREIG